MKIGYIYGYSAYPPQGGNHVHALQLMRQFMAAGHEVLTWGDDTVPGVRALPRSAQGAQQLSAEADILYLRVDANSVELDPFVVGLLDSTSVPTVWEINAPANETLAFSMLGPKDRVGDTLRRRVHAWRKRPWIRREEALRRRLARRVQHAVCVSSALGDYARDTLGIENVLVLPNGADHNAARPDGPVATIPGAETASLKVIYSGSPIYPWQGLDILERTILLCAAEADPIHFLLLMNQKGPQPISATNASTFVKVPHAEVSNYVRAADVGVAIHPDYPWSPWGFHNSPMKMFDYMACGRPVVASAHGQMKELIEPGVNGLLFDNSPEDLRRQLLELARAPELVTRMGAAGRRQVEATFNWQYIAERTLEMFDEVAGQSVPA